MPIRGMQSISTDVNNTSDAELGSEGPQTSNAYNLREKKSAAHEPDYSLKNSYWYTPTLTAFKTAPNLIALERPYVSYW